MAFSAAQQPIDPVLGLANVVASDGRILTAGRLVHATLPKTYPAAAMKAAGDRYWASVGSIYPKPHIVAIADSGVPLASSIVMTAADGVVQSMVAVSPRHHFRALDLHVDEGESLVVVDNSIHTGATAFAALSALGRISPVTAFVKLFDYGDELESSVRFDLFLEFGVDVRSLYEISEIGARAHR